MRSFAFERTLRATGYLDDVGPVKGLLTDPGEAGPRLGPAMASDRVGLAAGAIFSAQGAPISLFKDSGDREPTRQEESRWHEAAWNLGIAPLLWVVSPTTVRLYDCYAPELPDRGVLDGGPIATYRINADADLRRLDGQCGRLVTETGAFWRSRLGSRIDRRFRVDQQLLQELQALENELSVVPPGRRPSDSKAGEALTAREFAQRLVGRVVFASFVLDRGGAMAADLVRSTKTDGLPSMLAAPADAFALFRWLSKTFNGDLFPMRDESAERERLTEAHLAPLRMFAGGCSLVSPQRGQGRLFRFRFDAIPVDLVSSIYQQFARSSAPARAKSDSLHYTPTELVQLTLDPVFEGLDGCARVLDPTCGSGAFLVEAFRRLVWKRSNGGKVTRAIVESVLYGQLHGMDTNEAALGIAAFGLYLTALDIDEEPLLPAPEPRFRPLIGVTLFHADALGPRPEQMRGIEFDAVVGNPPWQYVSRHRAGRGRHVGGHRPRRSPDQEFLLAAAGFAGTRGRVGMVMKATPFFSRDEYALKSRDAILEALKPAAILNLSQLRHEGLFPDATGPACIFLARCSPLASGAGLTLGSVPWSASFARNGIFEIGPGDLRTVSLARVLSTPALLKAATFGIIRDVRLTERLQKGCVALDAWLDGVGVRRGTYRGQGLQRVGRDRPAPAEYRDMPILTPKEYVPLRLDASALPRFPGGVLHFARSISIFRSPLLIVPKACNKAALEQGRFSATISQTDVLYTSSFYGISFRDLDPRYAHVLSAILNSSLTSHQLAFAGAAWGLERTTVEAGDLLALRVPRLDRAEAGLLQAAMEAEQSLARASSGDRAGALERLDDCVFELYDLDQDERTIAREAVRRARPMVFDSRRERALTSAPPSAETMSEYADQTVGVINAYLRARGERHLEAELLQLGGIRDEEAGLSAVRFRMVAGRPPDMVPAARRPGSPPPSIAAILADFVEASRLPYLNEKRQLRVYGPGGEMTFIKPRQARYWTGTAGLDDADLILSDHWGLDDDSR